jgi:DNA-nicking Smr family endonuclease
MTRPRRTRSLSLGERRLWAQVARGVVPIKGRVVPSEPDAERSDGEAPRPPAEPAGPVRTPSPGPGLPPQMAVDRKTLLALRRGSRSVDAVIDLHGMRQSEAHGALLRFLARAQNARHSLVLVITGKGGAGIGNATFEERGVLRRMVPHWLRLPELRGIVLGFDEASPQHGGSGALYVRLRRRRA